MKTWQIQEAKNRLSEVVDKALQIGPQVITRRGTEVVVVVSASAYRQMTASQQKLSDFFRESPLVGINLDLRRDPRPARRIPTL